MAAEHYLCHNLGIHRIGRTERVAWGKMLIWSRVLLTALLEKKHRLAKEEAQATREEG